MGFIKYAPIGKKAPRDLITTQKPEKQLWQEIVMIRYLKYPKGITAKLATSAWFDQARTYFLDANRSQWRSAGLLYYYSFLNLAKAFLVAKKGITVKKVKSSNVYHGLSAIAQAPSQLTDFEINIHPPTTNNNTNIFSSLYEKLLKTNWPHTSTITISVKDILPYCRDISHEIETFYNIKSNIIDIQSLYRMFNNKVWLDLLLLDVHAASLQSNIQTINFTVHPPSSISEVDKNDWLAAFNRTVSSLKGNVFLRTQPVAVNDQNHTAMNLKLHKTMIRAFDNTILPMPVAGTSDDRWQFIPKITLANISMHWHPLLSDYLLAYVFSTILRYHPHLFTTKSKDSFLAEAWCSQSATTTLRYFLMSLTTPPRRLN